MKTKTAFSKRKTNREIQNGNNTEENVIQNLKDAGCDEDTITAFIKYTRDGRLDNGLKLLAAYRQSLLEDIHKEQKQIDCLDYLVYSIQKKSNA